MDGLRDGRRLQPNGPRARGSEVTSPRGGPVPHHFPGLRPPVSLPGPFPFLPSPLGESLGAPSPPARFLYGVTLPRGETRRFAVARGSPYPGPAAASCARPGGPPQVTPCALVGRSVSDVAEPPPGSFSPLSLLSLSFIPSV